MNTPNLIVYKQIPQSDFGIGLLLLLAGVIGLCMAVPFILQIFNPKREILLVITPDEISIPSSSKKQKSITLSWNDITKIHWENYKVRQGKGFKKHQMLCFCTKDNHITINSRYLAMPAVELFEAIKAHYNGRILREYEQGKYQVFTKLGDFWDWR